MPKYLLYDAGCDVCTSIAAEVEHVAGNALSARPLDDPLMAKTITRHDPTGGRKPRLIIETDKSTRVLSGTAMSIALAKDLGPRKALRVNRIVRNAMAEGDPTGRRSFLRNLGLGAAAIGGFGATANSALAADNAGQATLASADMIRLRSEALSNQKYRANLDLARAQGYDVSLSESVGVSLGGNDRLMFTFVAHAERPEREAAVISYERVNGVERVAVESVVGDPNQVARSAKLSDALTVGSLSPAGAAAPTGAGEYFGCVTFCVGANCAGPAARCRMIPFMYAMLACMVAVCGSKVRVCHRICKSKW